MGKDDLEEQLKLTSSTTYIPIPLHSRMPAWSGDALVQLPVVSTVLRVVPCTNTLRGMGLQTGVCLSHITLIKHTGVILYIYTRFKDMLEFLVSQR